MANKTKKLKLSPTVQLIMATTLFAVATILSRGASMTSWEESLFKALYDTPPFIYPLVFVITQAGSIHALALLLAFFLLTKRYQSSIRLLLTASLAYLLTGLAKDIWGRTRPHELLGIANLDYIVRGPGYPSGHVALATAMALVVGRYLPSKYRWIVPVWIILVAWSRMYLGIHAPLDIVGGFAIGWASYALFCHVRIYNLIRRRKVKNQAGKK